MNGDVGTERAIGRLEGKVSAIDARGEKIASRLDEMAKDIVAINTTLSEARGGWKAFVAVGAAVGAIAGAIGAFVGKLMPLLR